MQRLPRGHQKSHRLDYGQNCRWETIARPGSVECLLAAGIGSRVEILRPPAMEYLTSCQLREIWCFHYRVLTSCRSRHRIEGRDSLLPSIHVLVGDSGTSEFDRNSIFASSSTLSKSAFHDLGRNVLEQAPLLEFLSVLSATTGVLTRETQHERRCRSPLPSKPSGILT